MDFGISQADLKSYQAQQGTEKLVAKVAAIAENKVLMMSFHNIYDSNRPNRTADLRMHFTAVDFFINWPLVWMRKSRSELESSDL